MKSDNLEFKEALNLMAQQAVLPFLIKGQLAKRIRLQDQRRYPSLFPTYPCIGSGCDCQRIP
ncbi:MAG: hypothetical protein Ct9H300mP11_24410 [Chloroflexota bacterium]|nr:MAG: hypothetical protein Ct9H300mP11_24410 [Chloroflexota bacterium]